MQNNAFSLRKRRCRSWILFHETECTLFDIHDAEGIADNAECEEAEYDPDRVDLALHQSHACERHEQRDQARHQLIEDGLNRRRDDFALGVRDLRDNDRDVDARPLVDQGAHDEEAEDRGTFREFLQAVASDILDDVRAFGVAVLDAVPAHPEADEVEEHEEDDWAEDAAGDGERCCNVCTNVWTRRYSP